VTAERATATKVCGAATFAIVPLVAAAWLPPGFPHLPRQLLLCAWGVGAIFVMERLLFGGTVRDALRALGFVQARRSAVNLALVASLPMWSFLPLFAWVYAIPLAINPDWHQLLLGVVLVNGITEECIHRGFVFGHLRRGRSFVTAATISGLLFGAQHLYLIATTGAIVGLSAVLLAILLAYPLAAVFESGGNSLVPSAILHTSSNAPAILLVLPASHLPYVLVAHMGVVLASLYLMSTLDRYLSGHRLAQKLR
jgi:membrane protease YdiL (CAAX protease family)